MSTYQLRDRTIQCIMVDVKPGGVHQDLPCKILKMILNHLPFGEIKKTRRLSSWFEDIVTQLFLSLFNTFTIPNINKENSEDIISTLDRAMLKPHNKGITLKLQLNGELTTLKKKILISYNKNNFALDIKTTGQEDFMLQPGWKFDILESLSVDGMQPEDVWSVLRAGKQTVLSLDIKHTDLLKQSQLVYYNENFADFNDQFHNLQNLFIHGYYYINSFCNYANNLVSLTLWDAGIRLDNVEDFPELPHLNELNIYESSYPYGIDSILSSCSETLKCLVYKIPYSMATYAMDKHEMPQLIDWYIPMEHQCSDFISINYKSPGVLLLNAFPVSMINLGYGTQLEKVKTVVLKSGTDEYEGYSYQIDHEYTEEDRARILVLCPNADLFIWNDENDGEMKDYVISIHKKRGFTTDVSYFSKSRYHLNA